MRVLIAEDSPAARLMLRHAVESLGHECAVASDGAEAWGLYQETGADVVISDWVMPGLEGPELCRAVRAQIEVPYTYFIFLTSFEDKHHALHGMQAGADDYLTKPLDVDDLQLRLLAAARVTSLHRQLAEKNAELERLNGSLFESARTDPLTQLGNRLRLQEDLQVLEGRVRRYGHGYCVALCDLDRFKAYNDRYGHLAGDAALQAVARTIAEECWSGDATYRYGGEELLVILPEQSLSSATIAVNRMRLAVEALAMPHEDNAPSRLVTMSAGIATLLPGDEKGYDALLAEADAALYRAKNTGRNCVAVHEQEPLAMR